MTAQTSIDLAEVIMASMIGLFALAAAVVMIFMVHQRRLVDKDLNQQRLEVLHQRELLKAAIDSQEKERYRIAHDLHDEIGALLTTSKLYFNQVTPQQSVGQLLEVREKLNVLFEEMIGNVRRISHDLRPVILENLGLTEAIESLQDALAHTGIVFRFNHHITIPLTRDAELMLYRIVQELVNNTLKHARATVISTSMQVTGNTFHLVYKDNGMGFSTDTPATGLGMKSIESRLKLLNGKFTIHRPAEGIHVSAEIMLDKITHHE